MSCECLSPAVLLDCRLLIDKPMPAGITRSRASMAYLRGAWLL